MSLHARLRPARPPACSVLAALGARACAQGQGHWQPEGRQLIPPCFDFLGHSAMRGDRAGSRVREWSSALSSVCCCCCWYKGTAVLQDSNISPQGKHLLFYDPGVSCQGHEVQPTAPQEQCFQELEGSPSLSSPSSSLPQPSWPPDSQTSAHLLPALHSYSPLCTPGFIKWGNRAR